MDFFCDIYVGEIKIIIKKEEKSNLVFRNNARVRSGFVCFLSGEGSLDIEGVGSYRVTPGSFFRYEAGDRYLLKVSNPCKYYTSEMDIVISNQNAFPRAVSCTQDELEMLEKIYRIWDEQGEYCYTETRILLLRFFMNLWKRVDTHLQDSCFISDALSYVHHHYNESFTIADLASYCKVSPSYLRNKFRSLYGKSVMQYREELRISRAKTMLESGEYTIKEIADFLGYCDVYHFSRKFKSAAGSSPSQYFRLHG